MQGRIISLLELCKTGRFGALQIGSSETEMVEWLGQPTTWAANIKANKNRGCHFDDVQIFFHNSKLDLIHIDWFTGPNRTPRLNEPHRLEPWLIREGASLEEIQNALHAESISFQYGSIILMLESNTKIYFDEETQTLSAISNILR